MISAGFVVAGLAAWGGAGVWLSVVDWRTRLLPTGVIWSAAGAVWGLYSVASLIEADPAGLAAGFVLALPQAVWTLIREDSKTGKPLGPYLVAGSAVAAARWAATDGLVPFG